MYMYKYNRKEREANRLMLETREEQAMCKKCEPSNCKGCKLKFDAWSCKKDYHKDENIGEIVRDTKEYIQEKIGISVSTITGTFSIHLEKPGLLNADKALMTELISSEIDKAISFWARRVYGLDVKVEITGLESEGGKGTYYHYC